jgi:putative sigma-54 modulation protein
MEMTQGIRDHVEQGLEKLRGRFDKVIDVDVILSVEKYRHIVEINLRANGVRINAKEASEDLYVSFDAALGKVDRQVSKHKDRVNRRQPRTVREARLAADGTDTEDEFDDSAEVTDDTMAAEGETAS